jgi:hypothetical protein
VPDERPSFHTAWVIHDISAMSVLSAAIIGFQLNFNTLAKAAIMGLYKR